MVPLCHVITVGDESDLQFILTLNWKLTTEVQKIESISLDYKTMNSDLC